MLPGIPVRTSAAVNMLSEDEKALLSQDEQVDYFLKYEWGNTRILSEIKDAGARGITARGLRIAFGPELRERVCERLVSMGLVIVVDDVVGERWY